MDIKEERYCFLINGLWNKGGGSMNINDLINVNIIEKYCNVKIADGGFSLHKDNSIIGMNIYDGITAVRDDFLTVGFYIECLKKEFNSIQ